MNGRDIMFLVAAVVLTNLPALLFSSTTPYSTWAQEIPNIEWLKSACGMTRSSHDASSER